MSNILVDGPPSRWTWKKQSRCLNPRTRYQKQQVFLCRFTEVFWLKSASFFAFLTRMKCRCCLPLPPQWRSQTRSCLTLTILILISHGVGFSLSRMPLKALARAWTETPPWLFPPWHTACENFASFSLLWKVHQCKTQKNEKKVHAMWCSGYGRMKWECILSSMPSAWCLQSFFECKWANWHPAAAGRETIPESYS